MATCDYTILLNPFYPFASPQTRSGADIEPVIARCLSRVKKSCKGVVAHTLENQVARIQAAQKKVELALAIAQSERCGVFGWLAKRRKISALKTQLASLKDALVKWVYSVYAYFIA
jgi:predicted transcriptional regulator